MFQIYWAVSIVSSDPFYSFLLFPFIPPVQGTNPVGCQKRTNARQAVFRDEQDRARSSLSCQGLALSSAEKEH
jgi:hypothetical protein